MMSTLFPGLCCMASIIHNYFAVFPFHASQASLQRISGPEGEE